jgi:hypothetical protein
MLKFPERGSHEHPDHSEITAMFLALGLLLASARLLGETARQFNLPSVPGKSWPASSGGPTVFGLLAPV